MAVAEAMGSGEIIDVEARPVTRVEKPRHVHTLRAEYVLAERDALPLQMTGQDDDRLLQAIARVQQEVRRDWGESVEIALDVMPLSPAEMQKVRRKMLGGEHEQERSDDLIVIRDKKDKANPAERVQRSGVQEALRSKFGGNPPPPLMRFQLLVRVKVPYEAGNRERKKLARNRAKDHMQAVNTALRSLRGRNYLRTVGLPIYGSGFAGSDAFWRSMWFDFRMDHGYFKPARRNLVSAKELAPLLRPPIGKNSAPNILRSGGLVPPAPRYLPDWKSGDKDVLPIGRVRHSDGPRIAGLPSAEALFVAVTGGSGKGKTELGMGQFLSLVLDGGHGGMFIDPHADAITRLKEFMTAEAYAQRVVEINFASASGRQPGWNALSMEGATIESIGPKAEAVMDSIAAAMHWHAGTNQRALNLTGMAAQALLELNHQIAKAAPEKQATFFQMTTLLDNEAWRQAILPRLSPHLQDFFGSRFEKLESGAITPLTNLLDSMRRSVAMVTLMGQSRNSYDARKAMDQSQIVLLCQGEGTMARVLANLIVYDLLRAAKTRADTPVELRRLYYLFLDELLAYDKGDDDNIANSFRQVRKFALRAWAFVQDPTELKPTTGSALLANRSHVITTTLRYGAGRMLTPDLGNVVDPVTFTEIPAWNYIAQVEFGGERRKPFRVQGVPVHELHAAHHNPTEVGALDEALDVSTRRKTFREVSEHLDKLDNEILNYLSNEVPKPKEGERTVPRAERDEIRKEDLPRPTRRRSNGSKDKGDDQMDMWEAEQ